MLREQAQQSRAASGGMSKSRVEAFSDGVFGFAITLLVVTIAEPSNYARLAHQLAERWPAADETGHSEAPREDADDKTAEAPA
ncbi:MAG TPA: TMEM175 family protein [Acidimicrobiales bacterium]|nr:TMEM175 family protein [Acidimicrobiales bacterium]